MKTNMRKCNTTWVNMYLEGDTSVNVITIDKESIDDLCLWFHKGEDNIDTISISKNIKEIIVNPGYLYHKLDGDRFLKVSVYTDTEVRLMRSTTIFNIEIEIRED